MNSTIEYYWNNLQKKLPEDQTFCLLIMLILNAFQRTQKGEPFPQRFTQSYFKKAFAGVPNYDVQEAVFRLTERIDWILLENDREVQETVQKASEAIFRFFYHAQETHTRPAVSCLEILLESVLELSGTMNGYITTPQCIRKLLEELFHGIKFERIADFCCGIAMLGIGICQKRMEEYPGLTLYGAEIDSILCAVGSILMELYGITGQIEQKDILAFPESDAFSLYDFIVLDIPRGNNKSEPYHWRDPRIQNFEKGSVYPDWIFIQDSLCHLKEGGYAAVLCTSGVLIRANESTLRRQAVENDWLEAVITLPANLYPNTRTGTELLIFHKGKEPLRQKKILLTDISQYYFRERRNAFSISKDGLKNACICFKEYKELDKISVIQKNTMLNPQTYSFKPVQYLHQKQENSAADGLCLSQIADITRGAQILKKDACNTEETAFFINVKDIREGVVVYEKAEIINADNPVCKEKFRIREDDILITSKGTAIKIAIAEEEPPRAYFSGNITLIRVKTDQYDPYVLFHYLDSGQGRAALESIQSGTTIRILNNTNLSTLKVPRYNLNQMKEAGALLKKKRQIFLQGQKALADSYRKDKNVLLDSLKEEL